mmetsp:Transcript_25696/g.80099  ORF Transcript_25696/g.80099 Transcript_25696/m.80099 type:complete len:256 (-) Transcript_25696:41-808(-)
MEAAEELLLGCHTAAVVGCLHPRCLGSLRAAGHGASLALTPHTVRLCREALERSVKDSAARVHYREILGTEEDPIAFMCRRRWLLVVDEATRFSQWRTETAVARLMTGVPLDGDDLFAALKRTFLASQVASLADAPGTVRWMHVLGAVEEQDPVQAKVLAREAWGALAHTVTAENVLWAVQAAHFADALGCLCGWLLVDGGPAPARLLAWLRALGERLQDAPAAGRYGPAGDSWQVRARHVATVVRGLEKLVAAH